MCNTSQRVFLSTLSLRRATHNTKNNCIDYCDFYPRSPCGERPLKLAQTSLIEYISIHALLAESDYDTPSISMPKPDFYPRSPCGERRQQRSHQAWSGSQFLSTLSLRRATPAKSESLTTYLISIHALLAESDRYLINTYHRIFGISIHALLAESDIAGRQLPATEPPRFLSTLSLRRAT